MLKNPQILRFRQKNLIANTESANSEVHLYYDSFLSKLRYILNWGQFVTVCRHLTREMENPFLNCRVPMSLGAPRKEADKSGQSCLACDVAINSIWYADTLVRNLSPLKVRIYNSFCTHSLI